MHIHFVTIVKNIKKIELKITFKIKYFILQVPTEVLHINAVMSNVIKMIS